MQSQEINKKRVRVLKQAQLGDGAVVYWMQRDQRVNDNWALLSAQKTALKNNRNLIVVFNVVDFFLEATIRQYDFMLKGLKEVEAKLKTLNISFKITVGSPEMEILKFLSKINACCLFTDFNPLNVIKDWQKKVTDKITIPFYQVDAHNIVPCWIASDKVEFSARTIRSKIQRQLHEFLDEFPKVQSMPKTNLIEYNNDWPKLRNSLQIDFEIKPVDWITAGETAAEKMLNEFINKRFPLYNEKRNDPNEDAQSNLSPYSHFGQISVQRIALEISKIKGNEETKNSFLEELIIRRELSDNYCFYNKDYDNFEGFHSWAKQSLAEHFDDKREYLYSRFHFENAQTHDPLWNAAQNEMMSTGKMHGFMRMYWAKKILEWSSSPLEAQAIAIYLNDKYSLDGRDPNGYTGIAWSIGGVHDRAWTERNVYGKIRYMNFNGCKRKFNVEKYIAKYTK